MKLRDGYYWDFDMDLAIKRDGKWYYYVPFRDDLIVHRTYEQESWEQAMQEKGIYIFGLDLNP